MQPNYQIGIKFLSEVTCCPKCGKTEVKETRKWSKHCNGHWNESIEFTCGAKYEFTPNFMRVGLVSECTWNPEYKARRALVEQVREEIFLLAESRGVSKNDMDKLRSSLEYWRVSPW